MKNSEKKRFPTVTLALWGAALIILVLSIIKFIKILFV